MTTVQRPYINYKFNQEVDDGCLEYKSIPMAVVNDVVKVSHATNDYTGIKQVYNVIPPRPKNINAMATSIARLNNLSYSSVVGISKQFIDEEVSATKAFVNSAPPPEPDFTFSQSYVAEQPVRSSSGVRLAPTTTREMVNNPKYQRSDAVSLILGDLEPTSGVVPYQTGVAVQTEWIMNKEQGFSKRDIGFATVEAGAVEMVGGMSYNPATSRVEHFRGGTSVQTTLSKPPSGKNISENNPAYTSTPSETGKKERFFQNSEDRFGTVQGTPTRQLSREDKIARGVSMIGEHHTSKRPGFAGDSATSGFVSPNN
jgi:hypothetical protein